MTSADFAAQPTNRLVINTLTDCDGNVTATWRALIRSGWRLPSLSTFRRRVQQLTSTHPTLPLQSVLARHDASPPRKDVGRHTTRGDVLVVAIDVQDRDVISSWVIPDASRQGSMLAASIREALALRSHLMLDLSEYATHPKSAR